MTPCGKCMGILFLNDQDTALRASRRICSNWVQAFRCRMDPKDMAQTMSKIHQTLATINLIHVSTTSLPAFAIHVSAKVKELEHVVAMHYRSEQGKDTIYMLPFLPRIESLLNSSLLSPDTGSLPGYDFDVAIVTTAKVIIHETRHVIGTLVSVVFPTCY